MPRDPYGYESESSAFMEMLNNIFQPCIESERGKNESVVAFWPTECNDFVYMPIAEFADFASTIQRFEPSDYYHQFGKDTLAASMPTFWNIIKRPPTDPKHQKVIYFITDVNTADIYQLNSDYFQELQQLIGNITDPTKTTIFRLILTKGAELDGFSIEILETIQNDATTGKYFHWVQYKSIIDPTVSDYLGFCQPLPPDPLPKFRKHFKMSHVAITLVTLGGILLFILVCTFIICLKWRHFCWMPDLGGIDWTERNLSAVLQARFQEETKRLTNQIRYTFRKRDNKKSSTLEMAIPKETRLFDKWEVSGANLQIFEDRLGSGAYATVYKGHLKGIPPVVKIYPSMQLSYVLSNEANYVAVKTTHEYATHEERQEFLEEINFMKQLEYHPHILSLIGCSTAPNYPLILTEICELGELLTLVRHLVVNYQNTKPSLEFNDLIPIAWQISDALTFLSSKHIIHRDVAARNVLITKNKMAKLSDFGLCRFNKELFYHSRGGKLPIKWMAPESIEFAHFSTKSDVWSFGVLLYEMYSFGKTPFHSINQENVLENLKSGKRLPTPASIPQFIDEIMQNCWKENPKERPDFPNIRQRIYREMEENSQCYGYLHFSKNYYRLEPTRETE